MPRAHEELLAAGRLRENVERDVQDVEFTIERDTLFLLQTRTAKRSADAADLEKQLAELEDSALKKVIPPSNSQRRA
jgi:pyruvate,orthophosphate dikinase